MSSPKHGEIVWQDLTVADADRIRDFYAVVVGWEMRSHPMGDYADTDVHPPGAARAVAGICHARGTNANVPPQWLLYVVVPDVAESARRCRELGGEVMDGPRPMGARLFCVVRDPAGACLALIEA